VAVSAAGAFVAGDDPLSSMRSGSRTGPDTPSSLRNDQLSVPRRSFGAARLSGRSFDQPGRDWLARNGLPFSRTSLACQGRLYPPIRRGITVGEDPGFLPSNHANQACRAE
jgi:hypothetical protein